MILLEFFWCICAFLKALLLFWSSDIIRLRKTLLSWNNTLHVQNSSLLFWLDFLASILRTLRWWCAKSPTFSFTKRNWFKKPALNDELIILYMVKHKNQYPIIGTYPFVRFWENLVGNIMTNDTCCQNLTRTVKIRYDANKLRYKFWIGAPLESIKNMSLETYEHRQWLQMKTTTNHYWAKISK